MNSSAVKPHQSILYAALAAALIATVLSLMLLHHIKTTQSQQGQRLLNVIDSIAIEINRVTNELTKSPWQDCSAPHLKFMRQLQFDTRTIKEIGFYRNNQLICTTGLGVLTKPQAMGKPNYYGNHREAVFINNPLSLFDGARTGYTQVRDNYHLVLDVDLISEIELSPSTWEVVNTYNPNQFHVMGQKNLYQQASENTLPLISIQFHGCAPMAPYYCAAVSIDGQALVHRYVGLI